MNKDLWLLVAATLVLWILIAISDFAHAAEDNSWMITGKKSIDVSVSNYDINEVLKEAAANKSGGTFYDKMLSLVKKYTEADLTITHACTLQWKLNKLNAEYRLDKGRLYMDAKADLRQVKTEIGYELEF